MLILSQAAVLLLLALIAGVFLVMLRHGNRRQDSQIRDSGSETFSRLWRGGKTRKGETMLLPMLLVDQLNPRTMESVKQFPVCDIPKEGVPISRPNAEVDDGILLSKATKEAYTVSAHHAVIAQDADGLFIQDCRSHNKMFEKGHSNAVEELNITDGMIVYLGMQPLRFSIPARYSEDEAHDDATRFYEDNAPEAPITVVRRRKR